MTGKARDAEFRHPEAVAFLESLTDEAAAKQSPLIFEHDGVVARYWREGDRQRPARRQMLFRKQALGRLPRLENWPRRSRLTQKNMNHTPLRWIRIDQRSNLDCG